MLYQRIIGGFHFNDRKYADDDLTLGSIDPYQVFRIFHEMHSYAWETGALTDVRYMIDQGHNRKPKIEAMIQRVCTAQERFAKAAVVDHARLASWQQNCSLVEAEECLRDAFWYDVRPHLREWRPGRECPKIRCWPFGRAVIRNKSPLIGVLIIRRRSVLDAFARCEVIPDFAFRDRFVGQSPRNLRT